VLQHKGARSISPWPSTFLADLVLAPPCSARRISKKKRASSWKKSRWRRIARTTWSTEVFSANFLEGPTAGMRFWEPGGRQEPRPPGRRRLLPPGVCARPNLV